ncbi:ABATE domain-containing protein [Janthinobacterium sp.]|uniref:CGNR zinc finger domain-containing protein n=1 Tax=Janthinobacterium sp. TaxID=1871054 RepID=UPI0028A0A0EE|nr:ABATE domain-containing protein [Janthinobacterium sp.]
MSNAEMRDAYPSAAPMLADQRALDMLNTQARKDGAVLDYWQSGDEVLRWLEQAGITAEAASAVDRDQLLAQARALRALARRLVEGRKEDKTEDIGALNAYLHACPSTPHLEQGSDGQLVLTRIARGEPIASLLGALAQDLAQLLVEGDFSLVRQCEHPDCVLWFYDRTKAHKRRWCSMALCGNRHKAAQFRKKALAG